MMPTPRVLLTKNIVTHLAVGILGAIVGVAATYWIGVRLAHTTAQMAAVVGEHAYNAGEQDKAIVILSQATAKDPEYYEPFVLLGKIFSRQGHPGIALEMYKKALKTLDKERAVTTASRREVRDSIRKKITVLEKKLEVQEESESRK